MTRIPSLARRYALDALIVAAAAEGMLEVAFRDDPLEAPRSSPWFAVPAVAVLALPLLARRRLPFAAPAAVWLVAATVSFVDGRLIVFTVSASVAGALAAFLLGNLDDGLQGRVGLGVVVGAAAVVASNDPNRDLGELVFIPVLFVIAWLAGFALRERTVRAEEAELRASAAEREREAAARLAVAEERARIARELHDIVAHSVSVMVLGVGSVRRRLTDAQADDREALADVERAGRSALAEMRRLLGAMRAEEDELELAPQPGLDALGRLLEEVGRAGLPVGLRVEGEARPLPAAVDLSAYRIVQEALTNVLKHAGATRADVLLSWDPAGLRIDVRDDGRGAAPSDGHGHGLVGMRERVKIYGGELAAGPADGGGFLLSARLPVEAAR